MIKKFICFIWGHKVVHKAFTGNTMPSINKLTGQKEDILLYKWEKSKFCTRCGKLND